MSKRILNPSFNEWLTDVTNCEVAMYRKHIHKSQKVFLKRCYEINVIKGFYFSKHDFAGMGDDNFRQYIHQLKNYVVKAIDSRPAFYHLKEIIVDSLTVNHTGINKITEEFEQILEELKQQPPELHDIRIEANTSKLYEGLEKVRIPNGRNKAIHLSIPITVDTRFKTKVSVYPNGKLLVMLGCTRNPLPYSLLGFNELIVYLKDIINYLMLYSKTDFSYLRPGLWKISYYHFNKDRKGIQSPMFKYQIEDLQNHSVFYTKPKEKTARLEQRISFKEHKPTVEEEQKKAILEEQEQKENEFIDNDTKYPVEVKKASKL
jgi:hypothetical protein